MSDLLNKVISYEPVVSGVSVPLASNIKIVLSGTDYDEVSLQEGFFIEGPSGPQYVGPGFIVSEYPDGIPNEDLRDILDAPNMTVPLEGTVTVVKGTNTEVTFDPTYPMKASSLHRANLTDVLDATSGVIDGFITWPFTTGTGSIEELPEDISTSIIATTAQGSAAAIAEAPLTIVKTIPADHAIQQDPALEEIEIEFNKEINPSSVSADGIKVEGIPVTDHPSANISSSGDLYKAVEVVGNKVKLKI